VRYFSLSVQKRGAYHRLGPQAYSVTLSDSRVVIARVARRFMPRRKTESEVATMEYVRTYTSIPVPDVHFYDSNPYNRLGGEYIIMSKVGFTLYLLSESRDLTVLLRPMAFPCPPYTSPCHIRLLWLCSIILLRL
jgi:hypothetical protein